MIKFLDVDRESSHPSQLKSRSPVQSPITKREKDNNPKSKATHRQRCLRYKQLKINTLVYPRIETVLDWKDSNGISVHAYHTSRPPALSFEKERAWRPFLGSLLLLNNNNGTATPSSPKNTIHTHSRWNGKAQHRLLR